MLINVLQYKTSVIPKFIECESTSRLKSIVFNDESILKIMLYQFEWSSYVTNLPFQQYHQSYKRIAPTQEFSLIYGINPMLSKFMRREASKSLTVTDQFYFYRSLVKYLKGLFLIHCLNLFMKIISLMRINQDSDYLIHVNISSHQLYMINHASFDCNPPRDVRGLFLDIKGFW